MLAAAGLGAFYYWKEVQRQDAAAKAEAEGSGATWCGAFSRISEDGARERALGCMSDALVACAPATMEDRSNIISTERYDILGPGGTGGNSCRVTWTQRSKPPQSNSVCSYPMALIKQTDEQTGGDLFYNLVMKNIYDPTYCE